MLKLFTECYWHNPSCFEMNSLIAFYPKTVKYITFSQMQFILWVFRYIVWHTLKKNHSQTLKYINKLQQIELNTINIFSKPPRWLEWRHLNRSFFFLCTRVGNLNKINDVVKYAATVPRTTHNAIIINCFFQL